MSSDAESLKRLVEVWVGAGFSWLDLHRNPSFVPTVAPQLLDTITDREEDRARVLVDAPYWLQFSRPFGVGLEVEEILPWTESRDGVGRRVISPLRYRLWWQDRMTAEGAETGGMTEALEQVAWEDGRWRLVRIWSPEKGQRNRDEIDQARRAFRQFLAR